MLAVSLTKASHHVSETPGCEGEMTDDQTQVWIKLMMYWEWAQNDTRVAGLKPWSAARSLPTIWVAFFQECQR